MPKCPGRRYSREVVVVVVGARNGSGVKGVAAIECQVEGRRGRMAVKAAG